ncbi:YggT family protein [Pasteurellaceae bacterium 22721_9_1]
MNSIQYLVNTILGIYMLLVMLRMWLQYCKADFYNPISQSVVKMTDPVLNPLRKYLNAKKGIDIAALVLVFLIGFFKFPILSFLGGNWSLDGMLANISTLALVGVLSVLKVFGEMLLYVLFIGAILSWFRRGNDPLSYLLYQLGEPILNPIRRLLPRTGMIDFSPMVVAFLLFWLNKVMFDLIPHLWQLV